MEEVRFVESKEVSVEHAAKTLRKFIRSRPETRDAEGLFTMKTSAALEDAGALSSNKVIQLQFISVALQSAQGGER